MTVVGTVTAGNGGNADGNFATGGHGGSIGLTDTTTGTLTAGNGGNGSSNGDGGNGGSVSISKNNLDLSNKTINAGVGGSKNGTGTNGSAGSLTLAFTGTFNPTNLTLSALSHLVLNGSDLGPFAGGVASPSLFHIISSAGDCSSLTAGTYFLGTDVTGDCNITNDGVIIDGGGHTITGDVTANGTDSVVDEDWNLISSATNGIDVTLQNIHVTGNVSSNGGFGVWDTGGSGGSIAISNSTIGSDVNASGGDSYGAGGSGGSISITASSTIMGAVLSNGNGEYGASSGGSGGTISITASSTVTGVVSSNGTDGGYPGNGGSITITSSQTGSVSSSGGSSYGDYFGSPGAPAGSINISGTTLDLSGIIITAVGGDDGYGGAMSGKGANGTLTITYTGALTTTNTTLSPFSNLNINTTDYGAFPGGYFPVLLGTPITSVGQCDSLYFPGTYHLANDLTGNCNLNYDGIILDGTNPSGGQFTIHGNVTSSNGADSVLDGNGNFVSYTTKSPDITLSNIAVTGNVTTGTGGNGGTSWTYGPPSGDSGGAGGSITIENDSNIGGNIVAGNAGYGGAGWSGGSDVFYVGDGGGGSVTISGTDLNLSNKTISTGYGYVNDIVVGSGSANVGPNSPLTVTYSGALNRTNLQLSALSSLTINGPSNLPGNIGSFPGGYLFLPGGSISSASQCSSLIYAGTYQLAGDLPTGNCTIAHGGIILDGTNPAGGKFTIHGNVVGANGVDGSYGGSTDGTSGIDISLSNIIVTGNVTAGNGGTSDFNSGNGGNGGQVIIINSSSTSVTSGTGGNGDDGVGDGIGYGGNGGEIIITNSTTGTTTAGGGGSSQFSITGSGGNITVETSIVSSVTAGSGGFSGDCAYSGNYDCGVNGVNGGFVHVSNSTTTSIRSGSGSGGNNNGDGGSGGEVIILHSTTTGIVSGVGGDSYNGTGGSGGSITITNSNTTSVTAGNGRGGFTGAGVGGSITISGTSLDLSGKTITSGTGGFEYDNSSYASDGSVTLSYTGLTTNSSTNVFTHTANLNINNNSYGPWNGVFNPQIFYWSDGQGNGGRTGDWGDQKNWWFNASFTTPAETIPLGFNDVIVNSGHITQDTSGTAMANTLVLNGTSTIAISVTLTQGGTFGGQSSNATTSATLASPEILTISVNGTYGDFDNYYYNNNYVSPTISLPGGIFDYNSIFNAYGGWDDVNIGAVELAQLINDNYGSQNVTATNGGNVVTVTIDPASAAFGTWSTNTSMFGLQVVQFLQGSSGVGTITSNGPLTFNGGSSNNSSINSGNNPITFNATSSNNNTIITTATTTFNGDEVGSTGVITNCPSNTFCEVSGTSGHNWRSITSSADGSKLAAVDSDGSIWTNSSGTWQAVSGTSGNNWYSITSSADGSKLAAVDYNGSIWTNSSGTWQAVSGTSGNNWYSITSSADGSKLAAVQYAGGSIWTNSSGTWQAVSGTTYHNWSSITSNALGDKLAAVDENNGSIWTNSSGTWAAVPGTSGHFWSSITSNALGDKLAAGAYYGSIWTNSSGTWAAVPGTSGHNWYSITSSADGSKLAAVDHDNGSIWTNSSGTWAAVPGTSGHSWYSITSSADGSKLAAVDYNGSIWQYSNILDTSSPITRLFTSPVSTVRNFLTEAGHNNWIVVAQGAAVDISHAVYSTATNIFKAIIDPITKLAGSFFWGNNSGGQVVPQITIATTTLTYTGDTTTKTLKWNPHVNWDTASTCIYSYNSDFSNPITTTCSSNDTSLPRPTAGDHTLYLRGTDSHGNISETSLRFFYDNTSPVWTSCGADLLDENRTYYLANDVSGTCTVTSNAATTTILGAKAGTTPTYKVNGNIVGNGHNLSIQNITVKGTIDSSGQTSGSNGANITVATSTTGAITANGATGTTRGGNGGTITIWNSDAILASASVTAIGGDAENNCGSGGTGGDINITNSDGYTATSNDGSATCQNVTTGGHQTHPPVVTPRPTPPKVITTTTPVTKSGGSAVRSTSPSTLTPIFTVLPPVVKLTPIKLTPVPTFGDTTSKNSFSLGEGISNFLFAPVSQTVTQTLGKDLNKYLTQAGFSKEQDVATIKNKPLLLPKATTTIPGLFTITTKSLPIKLVNQDFTTDNIVPVSTYLTSDKTTLQEKVTTTSNTQITITLKGGKTAMFNNQTLTFTNNSLTLTTPSTPGTYILTTSASPLPLVIEVSSNKAKTTSNTTTPTEAPKESWFTKLLNFFKL